MPGAILTPPRAAARLTACALALLLGGCGAASVGSGHTPAADPAIAREALLRPADLPGWAVAPSARASELLVTPVLAGCLQLSAPGREAAPVFAASPSLERGGGAISESVAVTPSPAAAEAAFSRFNRPRTQTCLAAIAPRLPVAPGGTGAPSRADVHVVRTGVVSESDSAIGYRVIMRLSPHHDRFADLVVIRIGRGDAYVIYRGTEAPPDAAIERRINILLSQRLRAALATR